MPDFRLHRSTKGLIALSLLCMVLVSIRMLVKDEVRFGFLLWNLFLAWVPFGITSIVSMAPGKAPNKIVIVVILASWLLFFPNAPYIITDLLHIKNYSQNILWFDSLLIFMFALAGLMVGLHSLQKAHELFKHLFRNSIAWSLVLACTVLAGFGVYLGRYCRLNSWDFLQGPRWFFGRIVQQFDNPLSLKVTLAFAGVLFGLYSIFHFFYATVEESRTSIAR